MLFSEKTMLDGTSRRTLQGPIYFDDPTNPPDLLRTFKRGFLTDCGSTRLADILGWILEATPIKKDSILPDAEVAKEDGVWVSMGILSVDRVGAVWAAARMKPDMFVLSFAPMGVGLHWMEAK